MKRGSRFPLVAILPAAFAVTLNAQVVQVTPSNLNGWVLTSSDPTGNVPPPAAYLAPGFETPPIGSGSVHLNVGPDGNDAAQARTANFTGTRMDAITALSYSTFTEVDGSGGQSPYLIFHIDPDGNAATANDELWFFEPVYQSAAFFPSNPQGPLVVDTWQTWNALTGGWYSTSGLAGSGPGVNVKSIPQLLAAAPNATIVNSGTGGVRIVTGFGAGAWNNFIGAADNFTFGTAAGTTIYDFDVAAPTVVTITPANMENWTLTTVDDGDGTNTATSTFVTGPGTPPLGSGSVQLAVGADGDDAAEARSNRFDGQFLRDLSELRYSTFQQSGGSGGQAPYILLRVDYDNNGTQDDLLFFEPVYQTGAFCPSNPQPAVTTGAWQTWDAFNGCWYSLNGIGGTGPGVNVKPLSAILAVEPDARFATSVTSGALRFVAGFGAGAWDNFIGNLDNVTVSFPAPATGAPRTTYNFDPLPAISIADLMQAEGNAGTTNFNFVLTLSSPVGYPVTVQFSTSDGTATVADGDYTPANLVTATFAANTTTTTATVAVTGDLKFEANETFNVTLANAVGATILDGAAVGTIANDDPVPAISITDVTQAENLTSFVFTVSLTNPSASPVDVNFATADGTAVAAADYTATSGTLTIPAGATAGTITVTVLNDTIFETNETFFVNLTAPTNATIADTQGVGTITNDEGAVADVSVTKAGPATADGATSMAYTITVANAGPQSATNVVLTDTIPAGTTFVSATPSQGTCTGTTTTTCNLGSLTSGGSATVTLIVTSPLSTGPITNTATLTATEIDPVAMNNTSSVTTTVGATNIPTMSGWMLIVMMTTLAAVAFTKLR